jgi:hypothetical protein
MCKAQPKALKPRLLSSRSLSRAESWSGLGRAQGSAWVSRSLSQALEPGLYGSEEGCSWDKEFVAWKLMVNLKLTVQGVVFPELLNWDLFTATLISA